MRLDEICLRDPFVLAKDGVYYLYGTRCDRENGHYADAVDVYTGTDLENWSGFCSWRCYGQAFAVSESGSIRGPWQAARPPLYADNGGHGMVFRAFDGTLYLILHGPNIVGQEHPILVPVQETPDGLQQVNHG